MGYIIDQCIIMSGYKRRYLGVGGGGGGNGVESCNICGQGVGLWETEEE